MIQYQTLQQQIILQLTEVVRTRILGQERMVGYIKTILQTIELIKKYLIILCNRFIRGWDSGYFDQITLLRETAFYTIKKRSKTNH